MDLHLLAIHLYSFSLYCLTCKIEDQGSQGKPVTVSHIVFTLVIGCQKFLSTYTWKRLGASTVSNSFTYIFHIQSNPKTEVKCKILCYMQYSCGQGD